ncbi:hypothetical protein FHR81_000248 [Actinoalloteichus hoggarensis]|uniref:Uncharacterized protein n=2 Tax=Actinoalloteichus hoggarensis TaxID=1470176 RepID=A0A221W2M6_9PSEU|nr:hypothetical protein [Actinoalloteichus hoggarensis]ASO20070.1 hypothetical protein AHOG_12135 [Actinoalloteichus hoggarensis]MBB5919219.1 hypothetical protein [Actinoalloteichus hoggarensis]
MTVPPNPQGPYGGQGPQGQPGGQPPYGQQPGPYGQAPQGGQPPYGQQQAGQFGQQAGQFGQQPPQFGQQPDGFGGPEGGAPKKSPLPWILAGGGVVVIAVIVVLIFTLGGGGGGAGSPQQAADDFAAAMTDGDADRMAELVCEAERPTEAQMEEFRAQTSSMTDELSALGEGISVSFSAVNVSEPADGTATAELAFEITGLDPEMEEMMSQGMDGMTLPMDLVDEDGWRVCDLGNSFGG